MKRANGFRCTRAMYPRIRFKMSKSVGGNSRKVFGKSSRTNCVPNMASDSVSEFVSEFAAGLKESLREARAEYIRRTTPIAYWSHLFDDFTHTPHEFYALVKEHLDRRAV